LQRQAGKFISFATIPDSPRVFEDTARETGILNVKLKKIEELCWRLI
jgi:hypothetical protein